MMLLVFAYYSHEQHILEAIYDQLTLKTICVIL